MGVRRNLYRATKFDKVVRRSVCEKVSLGTRTHSEKSEDFLVCVCCDGHALRPRVGLAVLNASLCRLFAGEFVDDPQHTRTAALLAAVDGPEVLHVKGGGGEEVARVVASATGARRKKAVGRPDVRHVLDIIRDNKYFEEDKGEGEKLPDDIAAILKDGALLRF